jgi:hypothetical protein
MADDSAAEAELWADLLRFKLSRQTGKLEVNIHDGRITGWWLAPVKKPSGLRVTTPQRNGTVNR